MFTVGYITYISDLKLKNLENLSFGRLPGTRCYTIGIVLFILVDSFYTDPGYDGRRQPLGTDNVVSIASGPQLPDHIKFGEFCRDIKVYISTLVTRKNVKRRYRDCDASDNSNSQKSWIDSFSTIGKMDWFIKKKNQTVANRM